MDTHNATQPMHVINNKEKDGTIRIHTRTQFDGLVRLQLLHIDGVVSVEPDPKDSYELIVRSGRLFSFEELAPQLIALLAWELRAMPGDLLIVTFETHATTYSDPDSYFGPLVDRAERQYKMLRAEHSR